MNWSEIEQAISEATGQSFQVARESMAGGGCINEAMVLKGQDRSYFIKLNQASLLDMFEAEQEGLAELHATQTIRVPRPICSGVSVGRSYLVMEALDMGGRGSQSRMGELLAQMHDVPKEYFGWHRDNTIGSTPQINTREHDWVTFYRDHRLAFQLDLCERNGYGRRLNDLGQRLLADLDVLLAGHEVQPSVLHGDLWGGNAGALHGGEPVIFDPATYYGDREADLAMTELFGGFSPDFYAAYQNIYPLDAGYGMRKTLYNLYHILNHANLFGTGYVGQAEGMMERLLAEV